jgi:catechol 2,3-dioxygenase-like lactoylglutathione lyase family enzyme
MVELRFPRWIGVVCEDFDRQRAFYREVLGLREAVGDQDWVQYDLGPGVTFELLRRSPDDPEYDAPRYQVGFVVDDVRTAREELLARDVEAVTDVKEASDGSAWWAYFRDPEGNVFEITQR